MQKILLAYIFFSLFSMQLRAQEKLMLMGIAPNFYVQHKIQKGETLRSIATTYGQQVGNIMRLNGMNAKSQLAVEAVINIPVNYSNMVTANPIPRDAVALIHIAAPQESLYRISVNHNKVPVALLQQWNNLSTNSITIGQEIIVGYIAAKGKTSPVNTLPTLTPPTNTTVVNKPTITTAPSTINSEPNAVPIPKPASVEAATPAKNIEPITQEANTVPSNTYVGSGFFTSVFGKEVDGRTLTNLSGISSTFKTVSGWNDGKYYILMDDAVPGSIVKITNADNKTIYAKVLWNMKDMKDNDGLKFRISNAAAAAVGATTEKFSITVHFYE